MRGITCLSEAREIIAHANWGGKKKTAEAQATAIMEGTRLHCFFMLPGLQPTNYAGKKESRLNNEGKPGKNSTTAS